MKGGYGLQKLPPLFLRKGSCHIIISKESLDGTAHGISLWCSDVHNGKKEKQAGDMDDMDCAHSLWGDYHVEHFHNQGLADNIPVHAVFLREETL